MAYDGVKLMRLPLTGSSAFDLHLRNGVVEVREAVSQTACDCEIELAFGDWAKLNGGAKSPVNAAAFKISGDADLARRMVEAI